MTIIETTEVKAPARKKAKRKAAPRKVAPAAKSDDLLAGLNVRECCMACNVDACVISGKPYCAHPRKSGLHPNEMSDSAALKRRKDAENRLRDQMLRVG